MFGEFRGRRKNAPTFCVSSSEAMKYSKWSSMLGLPLYQTHCILSTLLYPEVSSSLAKMVRGQINFFSSRYEHSLKVSRQPPRWRLFFLRGWSYKRFLWNVYKWRTRVSWIPWLYLTIASCFWTWWRTQPIPKWHPDIRPYVRARKYLRANAQSVNVPMAIIDDLILASRKAVIQDTHSLFVTNGCYAILQMLEVVETCMKLIPFVPNDEANSQARGLETWLHSGKECVAFARKSTPTMDPFWPKMANSVPLTRTWI